MIVIQDLFCSFFSYRPLFIALPHAKRVLEDGVHDSADAKRWLDNVWNNLLHFRWEKRFISWPSYSQALGQVCSWLLPCKVFWNLLTLTMSLVSLKVLPSVSILNSLQTKTQQHQISSFIHRLEFSLPYFFTSLTHFHWGASPDQWCSIRHKLPGAPGPAWRLSCRPFLWLLFGAQTGQH